MATPLVGTFTPVVLLGLFGVERSVCGQDHPLMATLLVRLRGRTVEEGCKADLTCPPAAVPT